MADMRKNATYQQKKKRPAVGQKLAAAKSKRVGANGKKGAVPAIQAQFRKVYKFYRKKKTSFIKSGGFDQITSNRNLIAGVAGLLAFILVTSIIYFMVRRNSYEVFVGGKSMGIIAMTKSVNEQNVHDTAVSKLATEVGANVQVNEVVEFVPVHSSKGKQSAVDYVISNIYKSFTYKVEACAIVVEGREMAVLKSRAEADELLMSLINVYVPEDADFVETGTVETVEMVSKYVDQSEIDPKERAASKLNEQTLVEQGYTIKSGDTLWSIANNNDMKTEDIISLNPNKNLSDPTKLKIGMEITILRPVKLISIRTVEEVKHIEVDYKKEQRIENPDQPKTYKRVVQQGRDGQKEVTYHVIRVNGFEVERINVKDDPITPSEPYIIEVGTKN